MRVFSNDLVHEYRVSKTHRKNPRFPHFTRCRRHLARTPGRPWWDSLKKYNIIENYIYIYTHIMIYDIYIYMYIHKYIYIYICADSEKKSRQLPCFSQIIEKYLRKIRKYHGKKITRRFSGREILFGKTMEIPCKTDRCSGA